MEKNKKSVTCEIRNCVGEECPLNTYNSSITELKLFKKCTDNITSHLKSLCIYSENVKKKCANATEQWLIQNRLKQTLLDNDICPKHQMKYGLGWRSSQKCQYPAHKIMKAKKCSANNQYISLAMAFEIDQLCSVAANPFNISVGSKWCSNCRLRVHPDLKSKNLSLFQTDLCMVWSNAHQKEVDFSSSIPARKSRTAPLSDNEYDSSDKSESFEEETSKETFNKSMAEIASNYWSPIKYQLRTNLNDVSDRTKKWIIRKSLQSCW